jgi:ribose 5-phosphate isomerase B
MIYIGSDHAGLKLKNILIENLTKGGYLITDIGPEEYDPEDDFPDFAAKICKMIEKDRKVRGILICGSGQGMAMAANKIKGIRAAVCLNTSIAKQAREHLGSNILCLGASYLSEAEALEITKIFLNTQFLTEEKYLRRIKKIKELEDPKAR